MSGNNKDHKPTTSLMLLLLLSIIIGLAQGDVSIEFWTGAARRGVTDSPDVCSQRFASYVLLGGPAGPIARSIVTGEYSASQCPVVIANGNQLTSTVHASPTADFPVTVCDTTLPATYTTATVCDEALPLVPVSPKTQLLIGDTGFRLKAKKIGLTGVADTGTCPTPGNFSACASLFDASRFHVSYQGVGQSLNPDANQWPYKRVATAAALTNPDLVVHVGDYLYMESPCPEVCTQGSLPIKCTCQGMAAPAAPLVPGAVWGDNFQAWATQFFEPSAPLLRAAPWIGLRGNHEICTRNSNGYFRLLYPQPMPAVTAGASCPNYLDAYGVSFANDAYIVADTSYVQSPFGPKTKACPALPAGTTINGLWGDTTSEKANAAADLLEYTNKFTAARPLLEPTKNNHFLSHCPLYAVVCYSCHDAICNNMPSTDNGHQYQFFEPILQKAFARSGLPDVLNPNTNRRAMTTIMSGHMHWFQYMAAANYPPQLVFGHGGTQLLATTLDDSVVLQSTIVGENLSGKITGASSQREFGYLVMQPSSDGAKYSVSARNGNNAETFLTYVDMASPLDSGNDGLSGGTIAGIAVGASLAGLLVIGALGYLMYTHPPAQGSAPDPANPVSIPEITPCGDAAERQCC